MRGPGSILTSGNICHCNFSFSHSEPLMSILALFPIANCKKLISHNKIDLVGLFTNSPQYNIRVFPILVLKLGEFI